MVRQAFKVRFQVTLDLEEEDDDFFAWITAVSGEARSLRAKKLMRGGWTQRKHGTTGGSLKRIETSAPTEAQPEPPADAASTLRDGLKGRGFQFAPVSFE